MKQQRTPAQRRPNPAKVSVSASEADFDVTYLTYDGLGCAEVAVHEVDRKRTHPVLDLA